MIRGLVDSVRFRRCGRLESSRRVTPHPSGLLYVAVIAMASLGGSVTLAQQNGGGPASQANRGEPAEAFLKQLRNAGYYDTAIDYLERLDRYPGVDSELKQSIALEKAQTYIDAAVATRNTTRRDEFFGKAESELSVFLKQESHPRNSEARLQLGKLQMVRAAQLLAGTPTPEKREAARESYLSAAKTFDKITDNLRSTLKDMQGAKIDPQKDPEAATLRDRYRGEFLQAMTNSGQARYEAAKTFNKPAEEGKELLQEALATFTELSEKYDTYVQGAIALLHRGLIHEQLGNKKEATDSYLRMLEQPDADPLRDAKFQATAGLTRLYLAESPARFQAAIDRGQALLNDVRPNERSLESVQQLQLQLARAYLAKAESDQTKAAEQKRSQTNARQLLIALSKTASPEAEVATDLLGTLGIDLAETAELPTAEEPKSLEDALTTSRDLLATAESLSQSISVLEQQADAGPEVAKQKSEIEKQLSEANEIAVQTLRRGLALVTTESDIELVHQARQLLAYLLYQRGQYRDATVVGTFLARNAPSSDIGLRGGLLALNSLQLLLAEQPDNDGLIKQLEELGNYLNATWPDNPEAAGARGVMIKLALRKDRWDEARELIKEMPKKNDAAYYHRLLGQLQWNESLQARQNEDEAASEEYLKQAIKDLTEGFKGVKLVDPEGMQAALILAKAHLRAGQVEQAAKVLNNEQYGPAKLMESQGAPDDTFASDLYSTQLQVSVQQMSTPDSDSQQLLADAVDAMEKLRESVQGPDAESKLTATYLRMARNIREQLDTADAGARMRLTEAFRVFLEQISSTTDEPATLQWVGQTLVELAEASMPEGSRKAEGQAAKLLNTAVTTFEKLKQDSGDTPLTVDFLLGKSYRLLGEYKKAVDMFKTLLTEKPMMLDAQMEAALAYELWAPTVPPKYTGKFYEFALNGAKPGDDKKNIIWGWGKISQMTSRNPKFRDTFFEARYHVALCRYLWGKAIDSEKVIQKAASDITTVNALYPAMGGESQRARFDRLLKTIQKELGQKAEGLPSA